MQCEPVSDPPDDADPYGCAQLREGSCTPVAGAAHPQGVGCSGFADARRGPCCWRWCAANPDKCRELQSALCGAGQTRASDPLAAAWVLPECACVAGDNSVVRFPTADNMTFGQFTGLVQSRLAGTPIARANPVCYFPGCRAPDAILTPRQRGVLSSSKACVQGLDGCFDAAVALARSPGSAPAQATARAACDVREVARASGGAVLPEPLPLAQTPAFIIVVAVFGVLLAGILVTLAVLLARQKRSVKIVSPEW